MLSHQVCQLMILILESSFLQQQHIIKVTSDNLDVVLEVNRKLQMVLEDTLLKNMMQQDNIKMLGEEIDRQVGFLLICR